mgnify:CR=1 FL=1
MSSPFSALRRRDFERISRIAYNEEKAFLRTITAGTARMDGAVAAARAQDLRAVATTVRRTRSTVFSEVRVTEPDGRLVARGSVIQKVGPATS